MIARLDAARHTLAAMLLGAVVALLAPTAQAAPCGPNQISDKVDKTNQKGIVIGTIDVCETCGPGTVPNKAHTQCVAAPPPPPPPSQSYTGLCPPKQIIIFATNGMYECEACPPGKTPDTNSDPGTVCLLLNCGPGRASDTYGAKCVACGPGTYSNGAGPQCLSCPPNAYSATGAAACASCPKVAKVNATHTGCICPGGTRFQFGSCVPNQASSTPVGIPDLPKKPAPRPVVGPGILESTPGLGSQGPAGIGTPLGGAAGGGARPGGVR